MPKGRFSRFGVWRDGGRVDEIKRMTRAGWRFAVCRSFAGREPLLARRVVPVDIRPVGEQTGD